MILYLNGRMDHMFGQGLWVKCALSQKHLEQLIVLLKCLLPYWYLLVPLYNENVKSFIILGHYRYMYMTNVSWLD